MAGFEKRNGRWIANIKKQGIRKSKSFATKAQAVAWATEFEAEIIATKNGAIPNKTFGELLTRYAEEISIKKRGAKYEILRIKQFQKEPISKIKLPALKASDFVEWRENRLKQVLPSTVNREMNLLSSCCNIAINEWGWLKESPLSKVKRPKNPAHRDRRITDKEIDLILHRANYQEDKMCQTTMSRVGAAFIFAIETAMRAGEIEGLKWEDVDLKKQVATLYETKNGDKRFVPLSSKAVSIIKQMPQNNELIFNLKSTVRDALFRKIRNQCLIQDLRFHDTRHEAITRLSKKLDIYELARMVGHRNLEMLMIYYNETAENIAKKLG